MKQNIHEELEFPQGITVALDKEVFSVKGPKGEVKKTLANPRIKATLNSSKVMFDANKGTQREKRLIKAFIAHLKSMIKGVTHGHSYKLKICSGHFPMTVTVKGSTFEIKNFLGETIPRTMAIVPGVKVTVDGQSLIVEGVDKELAGQTAASIETLTRRANFDRRVFQDGIFIIEKDGKPMIKN